jgi:glycosyltransferase involved in cell wall biosynthesis
LSDFTPLPQPIPISEQKWPEGTVPLLTTRTMTFNHEAFIEDCIEGILKQKTTFPVQVLIHDDASTDNTVQILKSYESKYPGILTVHYQQINTYSLPDKHELRKRFLNLIKGRYIAMCEGDDYWTVADKLERQVQYLERNPEVAMVFHDFTRSDGQKTIDRNKFPILSEREGYVLAFKEIFNTQIQVLTMVYRKGIQRPEGLNILKGDVLLIALLAEKGKVAYLDFKGAFYRMHAGGIHAGNSKYKRILNSIATREKMIAVFKHPVKGQLYAKMAYLHKELAKLDLIGGNFMKLIANLGQMVKYQFLYLFSG